MNQLIEFASKKEGRGTISIKLRELLSLLPKDQLQKDIVTQFPPVDIGSITLVDQIVLLSFINLLNPKNILEIGTFQGYTSALFLKNTIHAMVHTIDLPKSNTNSVTHLNKKAILLDGDYNDDFLRQIQNISGETYLQNLEKSKCDRLRLIKANSMQFDYSVFDKSIDFAFIDGGHNLKNIESDTRNVLSCMNEKGIIVWHDFTSNLHSDVTTFLNSYSLKNKVFFVKGSLCAFQIIY